MTTAYPLTWLAGWPRKTDAQRVDARFNPKARQTINYSGGGSSSYLSSKARTVSDGVNRVLDELGRRGAAARIIETTRQLWEQQIDNRLKTVQDLKDVTGLKRHSLQVRWFVKHSA